MKELNMSQVTQLANELLILNILQLHSYVPSELAEYIRYKDIEGLNYSNINRYLSSLIKKGILIKDKTAAYALTQPGRKYHEELKSRFSDIAKLLLDFDDSLPKRLDRTDSSMKLKPYQNCTMVKIIPYSVLRLPNQNENTFFLHTIPAKGNRFIFDGRGLGIGNFSGCLIAFKNNNVIKFIAVLDKYHDETDIGGEKYMIFKKNTIKRLTSPITAREIADHIDPAFRFVRNKQVFDKKEDVAAFLTICGRHL